MHVIGPAELRASEQRGENIVWTVSHATENWQRELSPFFLGPVPLYGGRTARCMENAWQYTKVYAQHTDAAGNPTAEYWAWATDGWAKPAVRYPMGKGAKPAYLLWGSERLRYVEARRKVYWPLYRDAVKSTPGYAHLKELHAAGPVTLFDFDGYNHEARGLSLFEVSTHQSRPMGHAFILKAMLLYGESIAPEDLERLEAAAPATSVVAGTVQGSLF